MIIQVLICVAWLYIDKPRRVVLTGRGLLWIWGLCAYSMVIFHNIASGSMSDRVTGISFPVSFILANLFLPRWVRSLMNGAQDTFSEPR